MAIPIITLNTVQYFLSTLTVTRHIDLVARRRYSKDSNDEILCLEFWSDVLLLLLLCSKYTRSNAASIFTSQLSICRIHCVFLVNSSTNSQFNIHSGDRWRLYVLLWLLVLVLLILLLLLLLLFSVVVVVATEWNAIVAQYCHALTVVIAVVLAMMMMTIICWMADLTTGIYLEGMMMMMTEWMIEMLLIMSRLRHMLSYFAYPVGNCTCHTQTGGCCCIFQWLPAKCAT